VTANERSRIAASIRTVARIWVIAPAVVKARKTDVGVGTLQPEAAATSTRSTRANGNP
jgi:hypothetical protein